jgi:hypothetical protein
LSPDPAQRPFGFLARFSLVVEFFDPAISGIHVLHRLLIVDVGGKAKAENERSEIPEPRRVRSCAASGYAK